MLKIAKIYEQALTIKMSETLFKEHFKFYHLGNYCNYSLDLNNDSWGQLDMVSIDSEDNVLGYIYAKIDRTSNAVSSIGAINFGEMNYTFSKDFRKFLTDLFLVYKFRKIAFSVIVGNPAEKMYDKIIEKYNGRIVGVFKDDVRLYDGEYYSMKHYEIFKTDFEKALEDNNELKKVKERV